MKILWVFNHPAPYKVAFLKELGPRVGEVIAVYERKTESDRNASWYENKDLRCPGYRPLYPRAVPLGEHNVFSVALPKIVRDEKPDVVVVNGYSTLAEMHLISFLRRRKIPYVFAINGGIAKENEPSFKRKLKEHYIQGADLYLAPDDHSAAYLKHYGADPERIAIYPYSTIRKEDIRAEALPREEKLSYWKSDALVGPLMPSAERVYVAVGSYIERKNGLRLLSYWTKVPSNYLLLMIGEGKQKDLYLSFIREHGLHNVVLYPFQCHEGVLKALAHADGSIFLTKEDIYGHVVNESLSQGTPVIGSTHSNAALKLLSGNKAGWLIDPEDEASFLKAIAEPMNPEKEKSALEVARAHTFETMVEAHLEILTRFKEGERR